MFSYTGGNQALTTQQLIQDQIKRAENGEKTFREALHTVKTYHQKTQGENQ